MKTVAIACKIFLFFTVLTGIIYPLFITGIAQLAFPAKANGSLIERNGIIVGSQLIGQSFDQPKYFSSRPTFIRYNPMPSGGSNLGLASRQLQQQVAERKSRFIIDNHLDSLTIIPSEMVFASASGLDPDISPEAARLQADRVSEARNFTADQKQQLMQGIIRLTESHPFAIPGSDRINVLLLNLYTDRIR